MKFAVEVVRVIEETVEIVVEADDENGARNAALKKLNSSKAVFEWSAPRRDLLIWRIRKA